MQVQRVEPRNLKGTELPAHREPPQAPVAVGFVPQWRGWREGTAYARKGLPISPYTPLAFHSLLAVRRGAQNRPVVVARAAPGGTAIAGP